MAKSRWITVRLTAAERQLIEEAATTLRMTASAYVRGVILPTAAHRVATHDGRRVTLGDLERATGRPLFPSVGGAP